LLEKDIEKFEKIVDKYNKIYDFNNNEFSALVSFCMNVGNIDQLTNNGKRTKEEIIEKMPLYCKANGKKLSGLYNRRIEEVNLFKKPLVDYSKKIGIVIAKSGLNIRAKSSLNGKVLKAIPHNNEIEIINELENGWLEINYDSINGFVLGKWVKY